MSGVNPHPVSLLRPQVAALTPVALLGEALFHDTTLSASGHVSCASCHSASAYHAAVGATPGHLAGRVTGVVTMRAVPSIRYLLVVPNFSIGPDEGEENVDLAARARSAAGAPRDAKHAGSAQGPTLVPRGGLFWDGRVNTLQDQAMGPLFNPAEMSNRDVASVAARIRASHAPLLKQLFGAPALESPQRIVDEAMFAVARYQLEDSSFHPYSSKYDFYLEGKATLSSEELRGLQVFEDPARGNCAACHVSRPDASGNPPPFTDFQYEALGVPRNDSLGVNRDRSYFDLGLCGPLRTDLAAEKQYCAMFRTPSLRNVATRAVFFHNGGATSLEQVLAFYNFRDTRPERVHRKMPGGALSMFDDVPEPYRVNIDVSDPPFNRTRGSKPAMTDAEMRAVVAFLRTLTDGYSVTR